MPSCHRILSCPTVRGSPAGLTGDVSSLESLCCGCCVGLPVRLLVPPGGQAELPQQSGSASPTAHHCPALWAVWVSQALQGGRASRTCTQRDRCTSRKWLFGYGGRLVQNLQAGWPAGDLEELGVPV